MSKPKGQRIEEKTKTPREKRAELEKKSLEVAKEAALLKAFSNYLNTSDGKMVVEWILREAELLGDPYTNSGHTAFNLGEQSLGRKILRKVMESGHNVPASCLTKQIDTNKLNILSTELRKLDLEVNKCQK